MKLSKILDIVSLCYLGSISVLMFMIFLYAVTHNGYMHLHFNDSGELMLEFWIVTTMLPVSIYYIGNKIGELSSHVEK